MRIKLTDGIFEPLLTSNRVSAYWINDLSDVIWMRFGTLNVKSLCRAGSLVTVSRELARYKLDLVGVQEVRWEGDGTEPAGE
jgi:hypothetical protein